MGTDSARRGPPISKENQRRKREMAKLRASGLSDAFIGRRFNLSRSRIGKILGPRNGQ